MTAIKRATDPQQTVLARYHYAYDLAGNRTTEQIGDVVTGAAHDGLNRLTTHSATGALRITGTVSEAATVTINGRAAAVDASNTFSGEKVIQAPVSTFTITAKDASGNTQSKTYEVDATGASRTFTYDANGNLTSDGTRTFEWDAVNRLVAVNVGTHRSEFSYDGLDRRTRIVEKENGATERDANLFWDGTGIIEERLTTGEVNRFFSDGESHNGTARYLARDHLGSIREVTDAVGAVVTRNDYDPYGRLSRVSGTEHSRFGFTGHMHHAPSGLMLALYRAYDPTLGRWLSEDPVGDIDGPNRSVYVAGRPIAAWDPDGRFLVLVAPAIAASEAAAAALGGVMAAAMLRDLAAALREKWAERADKEAENDAINERKFNEDANKKPRDPRDYPREKRPEHTLEDIEKTQRGHRKGGKDPIESVGKSKGRVPKRGTPSGAPPAGKSRDEC